MEKHRCVTRVDRIAFQLAAPRRFLSPLPFDLRKQMKGCIRIRTTKSKSKSRLHHILILAGSLGRLYRYDMWVDLPKSNSCDPCGDRRLTFPGFIRFKGSTGNSSAKTRTALLPPTCSLHRLHQVHRPPSQLLIQVLDLTHPNSVFTTTRSVQSYRSVNHLMHSFSYHRKFFFIRVRAKE